MEPKEQLNHDMNMPSVMGCIFIAWLNPPLALAHLEDMIIMTLANAPVMNVQTEHAQNLFHYESSKEIWAHK